MEDKKLLLSYKNYSPSHENIISDVIGDGIRFVKVKCTGSMRPTFSCNNTLIITKHYKNLSIGDIVGYMKDDKIIVHRIVDINESCIITKGDNNIYPDEPVNKTDIVFKVVGIIF